MKRGIFGWWRRSEATTTVTTAGKKAQVRHSDVDSMMPGGNGGEHILSGDTGNEMGGSVRPEDNKDGGMMVTGGIDKWRGTIVVERRRAGMGSEEDSDEQEAT